MTCEPIVREAHVQTAQSSTSYGPLSRVRPEYTKAYSMMNILGNIARDAPRTTFGKFLITGFFIDEIC